MNNKIKISTFYKAGGIIEFRLRRDLYYLCKDIPIILYANSEESFIELKDKLNAINFILMTQYGLNFLYENLIEYISICCNGISYSYMKGFSSFADLCESLSTGNGYLYAEGHYYRGITI